MNCNISALKRLKATIYLVELCSNVYIEKVFYLVTGSYTLLTGDGRTHVESHKHLSFVLHSQHMKPRPPRPPHSSLVHYVLGVDV